MNDSIEQHNNADTEESAVTLGYISGVFGVKGWVKVFSDTVPRDNILNYSHWNLTGNPEASARARAKKPVQIGSDTVAMDVLEGRLQGKVIVARLKGIDTREDAAALTGASILVQRSDLPRLKQDEYYWSDLIGMAVVNTEGDELGTVTRLFETGANDVMVVKGERERLIPWVQELGEQQAGSATVVEVSLEKQLITVDWGRDWDLDE